MTFKHTRKFQLGASVLAAALLAACGGGGDDEDNGTGSSAQQTQAKKVAARGFSGPVNYDFLFSSLSLFALDLARVNSSGNFSCVGNTGSVVYTVTDNDASGTLSVNDAINLTLTNCVVSSGLHPVSGTASVLLTTATNMADFLDDGDAGRVAMTLTLGNVQQPALGAAYNGSYTIDARALTNGGDVTIVTGMPTLNVTATSGANATYTNFSSTTVYTANSSTTTALTGTVATSISGLGNVQYAMTLPAVLTGSGGQVKLTSATQSVLVTFGTNRSLNIKLDEGNNGSNEADFGSSVDAIYAVLFTP